MAFTTDAPTTTDPAQTAATPAASAATDSGTLRVPDSTGALYIAPDGRQARVHARDCLYARRVVNDRQGERFIEYRRRTVARLLQVGDFWYIEWADDYDLGRQRAPLRAVLATMATGDPAGPDHVDATYSQTSPDGFDVHDTTGTWRTWEPARQHERTPAVDLTFQQISGRGCRTTVNAFLEGETAPVDHALGGVGKWKAAFVARDHAGDLVSVLVTHFYHPSQNGSELCITRLANRADAPENTSSWMLANVREWAPTQGYDTLATYAGVGANSGTCYAGAGFQPDAETVEREGASWNRGDDSDDSDDEDGGEESPGTWERRKWTCDLGGGDDA